MVIKKINENDLPGPYVEIADISWASCNLGATRPCEYGDYYMFGSTKPNTNDNCTWANAPFNNGSKDYDGVYFKSIKDIVCPNGVLAPEYDVIYQSTNGVARMPTIAEFQSLYDNTTHELCYCTYMDSDQHSIQGMLFISKEDDSKKIFIPFSGRHYNEAIYNAGREIYLWSSSLCSSYTQLADYFCCYNGCVNPNISLSRYYGFALRGVKN